MKHILIGQEKRYFEYLKRWIQEEQSKENYPFFFTFPLGVQFDLTSRCNLQCLHCYNDSTSDLQKEDRMTRDQWMDVARHIIEEGGLFEVVFSGGEPLLTGDLLFDLLELFDNNITKMTVISNGYLLDEKRANAFKQYKNLTLRLSIDGCSEALHDYMRQVPGSFMRVTKAARLLAGHKIPFEISSCVTPVNIDSMDSMAKLAYELGACSLTFDTLGLSGRTAKNRHLLLDSGQMDRFYECVTGLAERYSFITPAATGYFIVQYLRSPLPKKDVIIRPNGDVRLTCLAPFIIGNVLEESLAKVWRNKAITAWEHPLAVEFLKNADVITGESKGIINYLDEDIFLDFHPDTMKRTFCQGKRNYEQYRTPSVLPFFINTEDQVTSSSIQEDQALQLLEAKPQAIAKKVREDGDHLVAGLGKAVYFINHTGKKAYFLMDGTRTVSEIIRELRVLYGIDSKEVTLPMAGFCLKLQQYNLIKIDQ